jgi:hypothetical protein
VQINLGFVKRQIQAGPYRSKPQDMFGVKLAGEINAPCDISIPIRDFGVPADDAIVRDALRVVLRRLALRQTVYVGCMGGLGRTGTFLALLAKALGRSDPVGYVRENYSHAAVETREQEAYVANFDVSPLAFDALFASGTALYTDTIRFFTGQSVV